MENTRLTRLLLYALNRPLALAAVALFILGGGIGYFVLRLSPWLIVAWLVVCAGVFVATVYDTLSDPEQERDAAIVDVDPSTIDDKALREKVRQALRYVRSARQAIKDAHKGQLASAEGDIPALEAAARSIYQVAGRLERYRGDQILRTDYYDLKQKSSQLTDSQKNYLTTLIQLDGLMREAQTGIDNALAEMGQSYASMQTIIVKPDFLGDFANTFDRVSDVTRKLDDISSSFDEAYNRKTAAKKG